MEVKAKRCHPLTCPQSQMWASACRVFYLHKRNEGGRRSREDGPDMPKESWIIPGWEHLHTAEEASYIPRENLCKMIQQVISALRGEKPLMFLTDWKEKPTEQNTPCPPLHRIRVSPEAPLGGSRTRLNARLQSLFPHIHLINAS